MVTKHELLAYIRARSVEEGECWIWQRGMSNGYPYMRIGGGRGVQPERVARVIARLRGDAMDGKRATMTCGNAGCVNPEHVRVVTPAQAIRLGWVRRGGMTAAAKMNIAVSRHQRSVFTAQDVAQIRASALTSAEAAAQYGVSADSIRRIRRYATWRTNNPWKGLMA